MTDLHICINVFGINFFIRIYLETTEKLYFKHVGTLFTKRIEPFIITNY